MWLWAFATMVIHRVVISVVVTWKHVTNLYEHYPSPRVYHEVTVDLEFGYAKI
jgi:hypothetical protein